jgi:hypothetical protein
MIALNLRHLRILRETYAQGRCWMHRTFNDEVADLVELGLACPAESGSSEYNALVPAPWTDPEWGQPYMDGVAYYTLSGPVRMHRKRQAVRFYLPTGEQVGPEQSNVGPAIAYATHAGWTNPNGMRQYRERVPWMLM